MLDRTNQIDLWPLLIIDLSHTEHIKRHVGVRRQMAFHITSALEICGPPTFSYQLSRDKNIEMSNQMVLLYCLLPHIPLWLANVDLIGQVSVTGERYKVALQRISRFFLQLPTNSLARLLIDHNPDYLPHKELELSASCYLAKRAFTRLMELIPHEIELYFVVLRIYSVFNSVQWEGNGWAHQTDAYNPATSAKRYLEMASIIKTIYV